MDSIPETPKIYQNHRENQLERILEAAETLFIREGIDNVSMGAIADAARLARKTLYQYFSNKQEIAFAIMQNLADERTSNFASPHISEGSGYELVEAFMLQMINLLDIHPEHFRFISEFNILYAREGDPNRVHQIFAKRIEPLIEMIQQGIADGSIRPDAKPELLSAAMLNLVSGMSSRFALLGNQVSEEYGHPVMELYREICRNFLRGIQSTPAPRKISR
jgi:AcrR family transcriptional regulator